MFDGSIDPVPFFGSDVPTGQARSRDAKGLSGNMSRLFHRPEAQYP